MQLHLRQVDALDKAIADQEVDAHVEPFRTAITLLKTIPGISDLGACVILAEIGHDMSRFPTQGHLISRAGHVSEERRERRQAPLQSDAQRRALAEDHSDPMRLGRRPQEGQLSPGPIPPPARPARRQEAIAAVAASMLTAAYHMLKDGTFYQDLGADHFDRRAKAAKANGLLAKLKSLGYDVQTTPRAA